MSLFHFQKNFAESSYCFCVAITFLHQPSILTCRHVLNFAAVKRARPSPTPHHASPKSALATGLNNVCACAGCHDNISKISARTRCVVLLSFTTEWRKWSREFPFIIESNVCIPSFYSDKSYFEHFKAHNEVFSEINAR